MTDLTIDKVKNMLGAHNDGVYRLETRKNIGEIVGWLLTELQGAQENIDGLCEIVSERMGDNAKLRDVCEKAEADYRGMAQTFQTYGFRASAKEAEETADYIKQILQPTETAKRGVG